MSLCSKHVPHLGPQVVKTRLARIPQTKTTAVRKQQAMLLASVVVNCSRVAVSEIFWPILHSTNFWASRCTSRHICSSQREKRESSRPISAVPKSVQGQKEIGTALAALRKIWPTLCLRQRAWPGPRHKPFLHRRCQRHDIAEPHGNDH